MTVRLSATSVLDDELADAKTNWGFVNAKQAAPASATVHCFVAPAAGTIQYFAAKAGTGAGVGESSTLDLQIGGVSCLTGAVVVNEASGTNVVAGTVDVAADDIAAGDVISVANVYVAGGAPAQADLEFDIHFKLA